MESKTPFLIRAQDVIDVAGGLRSLARALGVSPAAVHHWKQRGHVPQMHVREVLQKFGHLLPAYADAYRARYPVPAALPPTWAHPSVKLAWTLLHSSDPLAHAWDRYFAEHHPPDPDQLDLFEP